MNLTLWGTRGSIASPGPDTVRYGGNTSCVELRNDAGDRLVLDAGTGIRRLHVDRREPVRRVDVLLTHLHMDHIQGLGFFEPLRHPGWDIHLWGPASATQDLAARLTRYLSPPLFPVRIRDLECNLFIHDVGNGPIEIPGFAVTSATVCHPGPTVGYRVTADGATVTYIPDHEPMLGAGGFGDPAWTSGSDLAMDCDVLVHDAQYTPAEYRDRIGWGHSTLAHAASLAATSRARALIPFHHDPNHSDEMIDFLYTDLSASILDGCRLLPMGEGETMAVVGARHHTAH